MILVNQSYADTNQAIHVTTPAPRHIWESLLRKDANALVTQSPDWLDCICAIENYEDASRLYEIPGRGAFVLPLVRSKNLPAAVASLYSYQNSWGVGGLVGDMVAQPQDVEIVVRDLINQPELRKYIRPNPLLNDAWKSLQIAVVKKIPRLAHVLDLQGGFGHVWGKKFDPGTRQNIRRAESSGLVIECDQTGRLLPVFYQMFEKSIDRWAGQQHEPGFLAHIRAYKRDPLKKFEKIVKILKGACRIWVAWSHNEPAAAIMVLQGANAQYTRGVMNKEIAGPTRANDLLHHHAIEAACQSGCISYHMGETGQSESLAHFKGRFGAEAIPYAEYLIERLPITGLDRNIREIVKKVIGFKDA